MVLNKSASGVGVLVNYSQKIPKTASGCVSESILISILYMIGLISWSKSQHKKKGRPYVYSPTVILRCFVVRIWVRLDSNRALHDFLTIHRRGFELVCSVSEIYNNTSSDRHQLIEFYESELGQIIYSWRGISVEPLIKHIKDVFKIDPLPVRGYHKAAGLLVLLSLLFYQIIVYYNCKTCKEHPKAIKHMLVS
jgi:hypothetical protein